ncbi:DUF5937 family protein [Streptomyces sp. DSM 41972]|uniref:DUF5937 family protein n=1 Tax=Streptomyces althioticus subsp. attaecolombicae TaxID=3075534 RepID=A0ABU3HTM4_9ACTN|nr:DUF5937 family protein [Streptomyces sp. DSM 41972]SCD29267.1 transcriptional regulator, ArsR family [Streptomyces sp. di188]SCD42038.1 transcriptional regulator, ArsR family [Streptomyces sp. di50b]
MGASRVIHYIPTTEDVAKIRFSLSPLGESVYSLRMLASAERRRRHQPWVEDVRTRLKAVDLRMLRALIPARGYVPDFLTPAPVAGPAGFADELEVVRATPLEHFVGEVAWMAADPGTPAEWRQEAAPLHRRMLDDPAWALKTISRLLETYWRLALEPCWRHLHSGLRSDVRSRMQVVEGSGAAAMFRSLNERVNWSDNGITVRSSYDYQERLTGQGLVLVPSVFCGPEVLTMLPPLQPMMVYPRPDVAAFWDRARPNRPSPLTALLGGVRAAVLEALTVPASTTGLAEQIGVTPGAISQHIAVLRECGLVTSKRVGRRVVHSLTETGEILLRSALAPSARIA